MTTIQPKVFVVYGEIDYEGRDTLSVLATRKEAVRYLAWYKGEVVGKRLVGYDDYGINVTPVLDLETAMRRSARKFRRHY